MGRSTLTTEQFIVKAKVTHGDKYEYTKVNYINNKTNVIIKCKIHGEFNQTPNSHLKGWGCNKCSTIARYSSLEEFIHKSNKVHNNYYDYSKSKYVSAKDKITIICPIHGSFEQSVNDHLCGKGCIKCGIIKTSDSKNYTTEAFVEKANQMHNNKYDYTKTVYINSTTKVKIICPKHGDFNQVPAEHLQGKGCPSCAENGFQPNKPAYLYYLKITTEDGKILYKIGITNRTVNERFNLTDLSKVEIVKQKLYDNGQDALDWETKLKRMYKQYQYKGPDILSSGNTEIFTENIIAMYYKENQLEY